MKLNIKKILIPTDFSATSLLAVEHAAFMAKLIKAELYLLHSIEITDSSFSIYGPAVVIRDLKELENAAFNELNRLAGMIKKQNGITVKIICTHGSSAAEIVTAVKEKKIDIVVMGTHGAKGFNEYFVGSNTHKTVTLCPCPVISVQAHAKKLGFTRIVLPIDDSPHSRQKVDQVIALAKKYASRVYILGLSANTEPEAKKKFQIKLESVQTVVEKAGLASELHLLKKDNLALGALKFAAKVKADLIAVMSGNESDLNGIFLNPFSKQIVNHSRIPVLTIKEEEGTYEPLSLAAASLY